MVLDFVGTDGTGKLALSCAATASHIVLVGAGGGSAHVGFVGSPLDVTVSTSTWGRRNELIELVEMAKRGQVEIRTTPFALEDGLDAYRLLHERKINGRAVIVPS